jgi:hypothetical protein
MKYLFTLKLQTWRQFKNMRLYPINAMDGDSVPNYTHNESINHVTIQQFLLTLPIFISKFYAQTCYTCSTKLFSGMKLTESALLLYLAVTVLPVP